MTKTRGRTQVMGLMGGSGRRSWIIITEILNSYYETSNPRTESTKEEVEVGDSSELLQRVEDPESQNIIS